MILCIGTMFDWTFGSLDYSQAYLNADIDELCYMRAPESLREYDHTGDELYWRLKKVIYGHFGQIVCIKNLNSLASPNFKLINALTLNGIIGTPLASLKIPQLLLRTPLVAVWAVWFFLQKLQNVFKINDHNDSGYCYTHFSIQLADFTKLKSKFK
jgi:hypothetical protein